VFATVSLDELVRLADPASDRLRGHRYRPPGRLGCQLSTESWELHPAPSMLTGFPATTLNQ
jgi:hypothetical protein